MRIASVIAFLRFICKLLTKKVIAINIWNMSSDKGIFNIAIYKIRIFRFMGNNY